MQFARFPRRAFTLIELLIVVAIIAILAAIAVPNFLEAQMRAKVSRVKNDFRTMATAIEAFGVDNNGKYKQIAPTSSWIKYQFKRLTTPVAYMTSIPDDPFLPAAQGSYWVEPQHVETPSSVFQWYDSTSTVNPWGSTLDPKGHSNFPTYFSSTSSQYYPSFMLCVGHLLPRQWFLISQGPAFVKAANGFTPSRSVDWKQMPYDPTNGTASAGHIVRVGP